LDTDIVICNENHFIMQLMHTT